MAVLMYPISTEKAIGMIERSNTIIYVVDIRAKKAEIKKEFEKVFNVKVDSIGIIRTIDNKKKAVIKINKEQKASDIALKLKLI
jgi:large subunit ribosomal protein L23